MSKKKNIFKKLFKYKEGFYTKLKTKEIKKGINKNIIKKISKIKKEPSWMLKIRLKAYKIWKKMNEPHWLNAKYKKINYQNYKYYSAPKKSKKKNNGDFFTKKVEHTFNKLGILKKKAVDIIFDSVSVKTKYEEKLSKLGIIFCSFNKAIKKYPKLIKKYICKVVPINDNFFSTLNTAVLSDGTFIYIPKNIKCPIELSSYFRINSKNTNQFERTLIILKKNSYLEYLEGCSSPTRKKHQLHAAVVEIILHKKSEIKYSTVQNWSLGNKKQKGGIYNFVTKRCLCKEKKSKISWIQLEIGSSITWKYPSTILLGNNSLSNFNSISITKLNQQSDTGTKVIHIGKKTKSLIFSKSISMNHSKNTYRSLIKINKKSNKSKNFTQCNSLIIGNNCSSHAFPKIKSKNKNSVIEHETSSTYIKDEQIFFLQQRGINYNDSISMIIQGFCKNIINLLPLDFSLEIQEILYNNLK